MKVRLFYFLLLIIGFSFNGHTQALTNDELSKLVGTLKKDPKGPYQQILWFCKDGSTVLPQQRCPEPGGVQRARYKDEIIKLGKTNHIFLGQILATTPNEEFWDSENNHSRLKQYILEKYLQSVDNGWILRRAQYYRGAIQAEDESAWGIQFLTWVLGNNDAINDQFFLIREAARTIPHAQETRNLQNIRSLSLLIAEGNPTFSDTRIKIHGQPDHTDLERVKKYRSQNYDQMSDASKEQIDKLVLALEEYYKPIVLKDLQKMAAHASPVSELRKAVFQFADEQAETKGEVRIKAISQLLFKIRTDLQKEIPENRLPFLDISIKLEEILFTELTNWKPENLIELIRLNENLGLAATGCGYLENWEWESIKSSLHDQQPTEISFDQLQKLHDSARSVIEWGTAMNRAVFGPTIKLFGDFEPLAYHFADDRIRSSMLLPMGAAVGRMGDFIYALSNQSNQMMDIDNQSHFRGLNPGFAKGELVVVEGNTHDLEVSRDKIYLFDSPPSDLKPIAGIATVSEGNMVSHVQLLARNLAIPNAVLSGQNLADLKKYSGTTVFYAVSPKGKVIMKPAEQMTDEEKKLFEVKKRNEEKITIPVDRIELDEVKLVNLRNVNANSSGKLCGPKAANLGQLKQLFPDHVVEGLVVPFGIFREHMDQPMPGTDGSYWQFLNKTFQAAAAKQTEGLSKAEIDEFVLAQLAILREAIKKMELLPAFKDDLKTQFQSVLGSPLGSIPVFLRSDTNMEDLKEFTGAGLNLTLFNILDADKIIQGIKEVWASPYSERSYKWRQSYLLNPENVYPSILIIPSVDVNYSGVLITKGVQSGKADELTIAFSRGAGGAVDGQAAESYVLQADGKNRLIAPAREPEYTSLPITGGTAKIACTFETPILSTENMNQIRLFAETLKQEMQITPGVHSNGPWDVELGFKNDKLWLFQVRPFVENKMAKSTGYLNSISGGSDIPKVISLNTILK